MFKQIRNIEEKRAEKLENKISFYQSDSCEKEGSTIGHVEIQKNTKDSLRILGTMIIILIGNDSSKRSGSKNESRGGCNGTISSSSGRGSIDRVIVAEEPSSGGNKHGNRLPLRKR